MVQFDFADVTGNSVLEHSIHFLQLLFINVCYAREKFKKMIILTRENTNGKNCAIKPRR